MSKKRRRRNQQGPSQPGYIKFLAIGFGVAAVILAIRMGADRTPSAPAPAAQTPVPTTPVSMQVREVASHFVCGCGSCDDLELATCSCPTAVKERAVIQEELDRGTPPRDVVRLIADRYGHLKPQFAGMFPGPSPEEPAEDGRREAPPVVPVNVGLGTGVATEADLAEMTRQLACACGNCDHDRLSDCECDHSRGAKELKAFLKYKIAQNRLTADEILALARDTYPEAVQQ